MLKANHELVTVIVPVYEVEKYLIQCIESIIHQTYGNIEVLLIDDGSTDNSGRICDNFAKKDSRVTCMHIENCGVSGARNVGLNHANGDYILFVDSDDYILPDMIENLLFAIKREKVDIAVCGYTRVYEEEQKNRDTVYEYERILEGRELLEFLLKDPKSILFVVAWNKLFKKELFASLRFPEKMSNEDEYLAHSLLALSERVIILPKSYYMYRQISESITKSQKYAGNMDLLKAHYHRLKYFRQTGDRELYDYCMRNWLGAFYVVYDKLLRSGRIRDPRLKEKYKQWRKIFKKEWHQYHSWCHMKKTKIRAMLFYLSSQSIRIHSKHITY